MIISHGVPLLLMITTIMYQVEAIMENVDQNAHCVVQITLNANQASANIPITVTVVDHVFRTVGLMMAKLIALMDLMRVSAS